MGVSNHYKTKGGQCYSAGGREVQLLLLERAPKKVSIAGDPVALVGAEPLLLRPREAALVLVVWDREVLDQDFALQPRTLAGEPSKVAVASGLCSGGGLQLTVHMTDVALEDVMWRARGDGRSLGGKTNLCPADSGGCRSGPYSSPAPRKELFGGNADGCPADSGGCRLGRRFSLVPRRPECLRATVDCGAGGAGDVVEACPFDIAAATATFDVLRPRVEPKWRNFGPLRSLT